MLPVMDIHPSVLRNRGPILSVLRRLLPPAGEQGPVRVLEIASGSGAHAAWFTAHMPHLQWQPSEREPHGRAVLEMRRKESAQPGLMAPIVLDAAQPAHWPRGPWDAVVSINMVHISPFASTEGLFVGAAAALSDSGLLVMYGPFHVDGKPTSPSNAQFDASLRSRNPQWGVRDLAAVQDVAAGQRFTLRECIQMPANNMILVFHRG